MIKISRNIVTIGHRVSWLLSKKILNYPYILLFVAIAYITLFLHTTYAPGNQFDTQPLGWWAWGDQGTYLRNARHILQWEFPQEFWYPILYPALGALFLPLFPGHPYFFINLICLLWFSYVFLRITCRNFHIGWGVFILYATIICRPQILEQFVVPWTTTLCVAFLSTTFLALIWMDDIEQGHRKTLSPWMIFVVALSLGLSVATRPQDAIIGLIAAIFLFFKWLQLKKKGTAVPGWASLLSLASLGGIIGPILYFGHRYLISQSFEALYAFNGTSIFDIFPLADIPEKFISLWLNGYDLYGQTNSGLVFHYPWLFLGLSGLIWIVIKGDFPTRALATAIFISFFFIYTPYFDLLPTGLWNFLNFHYFIWAFPYLGLFGLYLCKAIFVKKSIPAFIIIITIPIFLLSLNLNVSYYFFNFKQKENTLYAKLPNQQIDFIDIFFNAPYEFNNAYCFQDIKIDEVSLSSITQTRCLALDKRVRLLFVRPVQGQMLQLALRPGNGPLNMTAAIGSYSIALTYPHSPCSPPFPTPPANSETYLSGTMQPFPLSKKIVTADLERAGVIFSTGWAAQEAWGRWTEGYYAEFLLSPSPEARTLELYGFPLTGGNHTNQRLNVYINGEKVYAEKMLPGEQTIRIPLPSKGKKQGFLKVQLELPDAFSPYSIHASGDMRTLGFGLSALSLE